MKTTVISYSLTGNNDAFASALAAGLSADHFRLTEAKQRKMGTIVLDVFFDRTPKVSPSGEKRADSDLVIFTGPVWMGKIASPFRQVFQELKGSLRRYAFVSISGGADGPNPKLEQELTERTGLPPAAVIDLHIADLLPADPKPERKDTMKYRLKGLEVEELSRKALKVLRETAFAEGE
jgi:hypothetical protein